MCCTLATALTIWHKYGSLRLKSRFYCDHYTILSEDSTRDGKGKLRANVTIANAKKIITGSHTIQKVAS